MTASIPPEDRELAEPEELTHRLVPLADCVGKVIERVEWLDFDIRHDVAVIFYADGTATFLCGDADDDGYAAIDDGSTVVRYFARAAGLIRP